jgi:nitrate/nitrite transport system substrate-binding protein
MGPLKEHPDYLAVAKQINQIELYTQAASALKINVPQDPMRSSKLIDGVIWDGQNPAKYADSFKIRAGSAA